MVGNYWHAMTHQQALHDPCAFASMLASDLNSDGFPTLYANAPENERRYKIALHGLREFAKDRPDLLEAIEAVDEEVYDFATAHWSAGIHFGVIAEKFRADLVSLEIDRTREDVS